MYEEESMQPIESAEDVKKEMGQEVETINNNVKSWAGILILVIIFGFFLLYDQEDNQEELAVEEPTITVEDIFGELTLEAQSVAVLDVRTGDFLYSQDAELQLPLASVSKVMTAYVASEYLNNEDVIVIDEKDLLADGDSGLLANEKWNFEDIRDFTLVISSNDGSHAIASAIEFLKREEKVTFTELMNKKAKEIGLKQTYFLNPSGLDIDEETQSGSYGSAKDMAVLFSHVLKDRPEIFEPTTEDEFSIHSLDEIEHIAVNTNDSVENLHGLIGSKTGFTDLAGGNLVIAFDAGLMQPYVISVLGSTKEGRFDDVAKLQAATAKYIYSQ